MIGVEGSRKGGGQLQFRVYAGHGPAHQHLTAQDGDRSGIFQPEIGYALLWQRQYGHSKGGKRLVRLIGDGQHRFADFVLQAVHSNFFPVQRQGHNGQDGGRFV